MLDILHGFLALYLVDVMKLTPANAAFALAVYTGIGLIGDFLLIPFLERVKGLDYLRVSVIIECILLPLFLLSSPLVKTNVTCFHWPLCRRLVCDSQSESFLIHARPIGHGPSPREFKWNDW